MFYAIINGEKELATKGTSAVCPGRGGAMRAKCGHIKDSPLGLRNDYGLSLGV